MRTPPARMLCGYKGDFKTGLSRSCTKAAAKKARIRLCAKQKAQPSTIEEALRREKAYIKDQNKEKWKQRSEALKKEKEQASPTQPVAFYVMPLPFSFFLLPPVTPQANARKAKEKARAQR